MTKERLRRYRSIKAERAQIQRLLQELEERDQELWTTMTAATAVPGDGMPHAHANKADDKLVKLIGKRAELSEKRKELQRRYTAMLVDLDAEQLTVEDAIRSLPEKEQKVLRCYYLEGMTWEEVCVAVNYSWRQTHRLHSAALERLRKKAEEEGY